MKIIIISLLISLLIVYNAFAQESHPQKLIIPDIPGYFTLKCDLHMHTVFSDGHVWPDVRVKEAMDEGLDAIAITDHLEYKPYKEEFTSADNNHSFDLAQKSVKNAGLIVIRGAEITRKMPPGHANALFIQDANKIYDQDYVKSYRAAKEQGAFLVWNHPCWKVQQPDTVKWFAEHTRLYDEGLIQGIEIVNSTDYCPEAFRWALEKNLTLLGNSDVHDPIYQEYQVGCGRHRPITIVYAKERSENGIKEALIAGRTTVWFNDTLYGREEYIAKLYAKSVIRVNDKPAINGNTMTINLQNTSDFHFVLTLKEAPESCIALKTIDIPPRLSVSVEIIHRNNKLPYQGESVKYNVSNVLIAPEKCFEVALNL